ncbi:serine/arginine repetitive matrix protein 1-like [Penaeus chinensis]|uniref:serine/arginine repetitive matrix protein 1-like n=1 Tax=Penaeus chinensis TaxID=139456 RepID=UPI001FB781BB|nr:serine/arginine repetitive matrix protein 1-like [Penaeus chinensis]
MATTRHMSLLERKKKQWEEERAFLNGGGCGFWGRQAPSEPKRAPLPTDKPPDNHVQQQEAQPQQQQQQEQQTQLQQQQQQYIQQELQQQYVYHSQQQLQQAQQSQQQAYHSPQAPPQSQQQLPMGMGSLNGAPVYLVMPPGSGPSAAGGGVPPGHAGAPAFLPEFLRNFQFPSDQGGATIYELPEGGHYNRTHEGEPHSAPASSRGSRGPDEAHEPPRYDFRAQRTQQHAHYHTHHGGGLDDRGGGGRARWGDRGVGVGHLWAPGDESSPGGRSGEVLPPAWAEQQEDNVLPGAPFSKQGQRTYARGGGMSKMDPEEMAEKERRKKQAEETQRIIKQQLEDKKRQKAIDEERERREAEMWEERVRVQQEREAREYKEEMRKKKEKEEAEERRQRQLQSAIEEAAAKARKEKDVSKYGHIRQSSRGGPLPDVGEEKEDLDQEDSHSRPETKQQHRRHQQPHQQQQDQQQEQQQEHPERHREQERAETQQSERGEQSASPLAPSRLGIPHIKAPAAPDGEDERAKLLRSLGLTPEVLFASSGFFDRTALLTLLTAAAGQRTSIASHDSPADYITDRIITPTKYRSLRECGTQCDEPPYASPRRETRRRSSRRKKSPSSSLPRNPGHASDSRPPWGQNHSDRPYRKQSEKDPYANRRFRRRSTRSLGRCERDTATEESDNQQPHRRRRKTWDKSRQESLSSDISRSPSPRGKGRLSRSSFTSSHWPHIKPSLTPGLQHRPFTPEAEQPPPSPPPEAASPADAGREAADEPDDDDDVVTPPSPRVPTAARSSSPPVPALLNKLKGESSFDVPEYPPGQEPPGVEPPRSRSPPIPTVLKRLNSSGGSTGTPTLPELPSSSRPSSRPQSPRTMSRSSPSSPGRKSSIAVCIVYEDIHESVTPGFSFVKEFAMEAQNLMVGAFTQNEAPTIKFCASMANSLTLLDPTENYRSHGDRPSTEFCTFHKHM